MKRFYWLIIHSQCSSSDEDVEEEKKNCDDNFGPWEEYGEETYLEDLVSPFKRKYKSRGLLSGLNEPIDFFFNPNIFLTTPKNYKMEFNFPINTTASNMSTISKYALLVMIVN